MSYENILIKNKNGLRIIMFNNPSRKNAWNVRTYRDISILLNQAASDDSVSVVALTGVGDFYSSGNDIKDAMETAYDADGQETNRSLVLINMIKSFAMFPKLLVAVVNGPCIGIAATTVALCDVIYMLDSAYIYTPFTQLGLCAEGCSSYTFPRILGKSKANEMLLLNHKMFSDEALRYNFISEIFSTNDLNSKIWPKIEQYAKLPKESIKVTKELIKKFELSDLERAWQLEMNALEQRISSDEFFNAVSNFMNRKSKL